MHAAKAEQLSFHRAADLANHRVNSAIILVPALFDDAVITMP